MIQVTLQDTVELATYTVRTFALCKVWDWLGWCCFVYCRDASQC